MVRAQSEQIDTAPADLDALVKQLKSDDEEAILAAGQALLDLGPKGAPAVDGLIKIVEADQDKNRRVAVFLLGKLGPAAERAVPALVEAAQHPRDFHTQYHACMALGAIGPKAKPATPVLLKLLKEGGVSVRVHSAEALGLIGREIGPEAIEQLTAALRDKSDNVQQSAVIALGRLGDAAKPSLPAIEKALADGIFNTPVDAVEAIYKITGDKQRVVPLLLVEAVGEDDPERAGELLAGLGESARPAVPKLIAHLASDNPQFRYYSAIALGHFGPHAKDAIPGLKKLADDPNPEIRDAAALAIEKIEGQAP